LQPSVEEVPDGEMPTPTLAKSSSQLQISSSDLHPQSLPKDLSETEDPQDVLSKAASKTSQSPLPATPATSPPASPRTQYHATVPLDYGPNMSPTIPHYPYPYPPNMAAIPGPGPFYPNQYYNSPFSPPMEQRQTYSINGGGPSARTAYENERDLLLEKVSNALPDLHRLLNEYKQAQGQLSAKELFVQQSEKEHEERFNRLKIELDANKKEYEKVIQSIVGERGKFEREVIALRQQVADLEIAAEEHEKSKSQIASFQESHAELEAAVDSLRKRNEELQSSKDAQEKELQNSREAHEHQTAELQKQHEDILAILSKTQLDLAGLISKHASLKTDLEASRNLQNDYKLQLDTKSEELEETHARHAESITAAKKAQEEDYGRRLGEIEAQHAKILEDHSLKEQDWMQELQNLRNEVQTHKEDLEKERNEHQILKATRERDQNQASELARGIASLKAKHAELQSEHENVDRLLQSLRPVTDAKSKGDNFL
jgi:chromosome segregation ATPase